MSNYQNRRSFLSKTVLAGASVLAAPLNKTFGQGLIDAKERTPQASSPSDLKITEVKCAYAGGGLFVKIYTNQGIWGSGEGVDAIAGTYYLVKRLEWMLKGRSPLNPNRIAEEIRKANFFPVHNPACLWRCLSRLRQPFGTLQAKLWAYRFTSC
ncbi:hypothetical protein ACQ86K_14960 [Mucilaginibacter sp. P19]|uniref:hypothetical protein n=1 Tax=Mucilaginibacter sp. P19 TaxID=3423947 RepID=UPI003D665BAA